MTPKKRLLVLEINELNLEVLKAAVSTLPVENLKKLLSFDLSHTHTDDRYESDFLEPWVQWVSIHTGHPSTDHQIKHLGDVPQLSFSQIWEDLDHLGLSTGVFGVMNGARRELKHCAFFLPDPWTFSESGHPQELAHILELPRYIARDYLNLSFGHVLRLLPKFFKAVFKAGALVPALKMLSALPARLLRFGVRPFVFISGFDVFFNELFLKYDAKYRPDACLLFLNSLAHLQHHQWTSVLPELSAPMRFGLIELDKIVGRLLENFSEPDCFVVLNGLSQKNSFRDEQWTLYRQHSPKEFLKQLEIPTRRVEPLMTHDAHLFFNQKSELETALHVLKQANINGKPLFLVEQDTQDSLKIFYRVNFFDPLPADAHFEFNGKRYRFFEYFKAVTVRTGSHIPGGFLLARGLKFSKKLYNHDIKQEILNSYSSP